MSGYSEHAATEMANADPSVRLMTKPFSRGAILRTVREIPSSQKILRLFPWRRHSCLCSGLADLRMLPVARS